MAHIPWIALCVLCACVFAHALEPASYLEAAPFAEWAVGHWVWLSSSQANQTSELAFVQTFLANDIPVHAVDIDSLWSTGVNSFVWDTSKYPNASAMVESFHLWGVNVICWVTSVIDTDSPNYAEGLAKGYYLNHGRTLKWWHGEGSWLDYTNPAAVAWWHSLMDGVLAIGVDGWKTDGTDPYVLEFGLIEAHSGLITYREYADMYYGDFFNYTRQVRGPNALIMSRPVDDLWSFSPRYVVFSGWVGDDDPTFDGLQSALWSMFHSAFQGYVGFGSDIGGYRCCGPEPFGRTVQLFTRWYQLGAFCSLMENGGDNEHGPWAFGADTLANYRLFVTIHVEMIPYLVSAGTVAYATGVSIMAPFAADVPEYPLRWDYMLWTDVYVCPMVDNTTSRDLLFPSNASWVDWWTNAVYKPDQVVLGYSVPFSILPVFRRQGSIMPLRVTNDLAGHGDEAQAGALTLLISHALHGHHEHLAVHYAPERHAGLGRTFDYHRALNGTLHLTGSPHPERAVFLIRGSDTHCATSIRFNGESSRYKRASSSAELADASAAGWYCRRREDFVESANVELFVFASTLHAEAGLDIVINWGA